MTAFKPGEIVDVTIKGVRITAPRPGMRIDRMAYADEHGDVYALPPQAAVERVAPAEWPPRTGDLWRDEKGMLYLGQQDWGSGIDLIDIAGDAIPPDELLHRRPTLVHREEAGQ